MDFEGFFGFMVFVRVVQQCFGWDVVNVQVGIVECYFVFFVDVFFDVGGFQVQLGSVDGGNVIVGVGINYYYVEFLVYILIFIWVKLDGFMRGLL